MYKPTSEELLSLGFEDVTDEIRHLSERLSEEGIGKMTVSDEREFYLEIEALDNLGDSETFTLNYDNADGFLLDSKRISPESFDELSKLVSLLKR